MQSLSKMAAIAGLLAAFSAGANAGEHIDRNRPAFASAWNLVVGSGAEYADDYDGRTVGSQDMAIVGTASIHGRTGFWVEFFRPESAPEQLAEKSLILVEPKKVVFVRTIVQVAGYGPMEIPAGFMLMFCRANMEAMDGYLFARPAMTPQEAQATHYPNALMLAHEWSDVPKAKEIGTETVTTPAGTFLCQHWQFSRHRGDIWVSKGAGPFGLVKSLLVNNRTHTTQARILERVFTDAQDKIVAPLRPSKLDKLIPYP